MEAENQILTDKEIRNVQKIDELNKLSFEIRNSNHKHSAELAEEALSLSQEISYTKGFANALANLGFFYLQKGQNDKAFEKLLECLTIYEKLGDDIGIGLAFYNLGILHLRIGNFNDSVECLQKSISIRMKLGDKGGMAACYFQMAYIHNHFDDIEAALQDGEKSFALRKEINDPLGMSAALMVIGDAYFKKKDYNKTKEILQQSLKLRADANDRLGFHAVMQRLVEVHIELGEYEGAREDAMKGLKTAQGEEIPLGVIRFLQSLGKLELRLGNKEEAKNWYLNALEKATNSSYKSIQYELYEVLAEISSELNDMAGAFEYFKKFHQVKEEVISLQSNTRLKSVQFINQVETAKREAEFEKNKNAELKRAYDLIEEKNKDITASIRYAKRLQDAILPPLSIIKEHLPESFVLYKPKDIVAGDFYWLEKTGDSILIAAADCTGHGVPGALVSVVCSNALNRTVKEFKITEPGKILDKVRELVVETFAKSEDSVQDGMDISLASLTPTKGGIELQWAGAYNSLWYVQDGKMHEVAAAKQPIGKVDGPLPFNTHSLNLKKGDTLYLFTDGYADQFGGPKGKKFKYKQLQELILANASKPMEEQQKLLEHTLESWKGKLEQVDDILIIGIHV